MKQKTVRVSIDKPYSSKVVGVKYEALNLSHVDLIVTAIEGMTKDVRIKVCLLRDNSRDKTQFVGTIDKAYKLMLVRVLGGDVVYVVVSTSTSINTVLNPSLIYEEIKEFPISFNNTYYSTTYYTLRTHCTLKYEAM